MPPKQIPAIPYPPVETTKPKSSPVPSKPSTPNHTPHNGLDPAATSKQVLDLVPELHKHIITLYQRAANIPGESVPHISYCEAVLRHTKLLAAIHLSNGTAADAIAHVVAGTPIPHRGPPKNSSPSRLEISENAMRAYPHPVGHMTVLEATKVLSGIASIMGSIGMRRRKAVVTRELLKILIPGLIQARVVGAAEVGIHPAAGLNVLSSGGHGSPLDLGEGDVESGIMELLQDLCRTYGIISASPQDGEGGRHKEDPPPPPPLPPPARPASSGATALRTSVWTKAVIAEQEARDFGWTALKIHVLRNCTALCEALPDFQGVLDFTAQLLRTADVELSKEEQIRLSTAISRTVGAARKLGLAGVEADYWDQFLLRDIEFVENPTWKPPIPRNRSELADPGSLMTVNSGGANGDADADADVEGEGEREGEGGEGGAKAGAGASARKGKEEEEEEVTPFIYNPFKVLESTAVEQILVRAEPAEFRITLQNPFEFEVEVESVTLDATGVHLDVQAVGVIIAPFRTYQVSIAAIPTGTGEVHISGCRVKVYGCRERFFPIFTGGIDPREHDIKTKRFGLLAAEPHVDRPLSTISATTTATTTATAAAAGNRLSSQRLPPVLHPIPKTLSLTVVESQPLLVVRGTSLSQSALMMLEGERRVFSITLKNLSEVDVDFLAFYFTDSTTGRIQQALADKTNSPAESYELELMLAKKRAFVYRHPPSPPPPPGGTSGGGGGGGNGLVTKPSIPGLAKRKVYIPANGSASFEIEALGKPGLTHGTIQANYSHLGQPRSEIGRDRDHFYTREVFYPVTVTVNASIELARVDFIPFSTDFIANTTAATATATVGLRPFKELFNGVGIYANPSEYCLMLLDVRNAWPQPLKIRMKITDSVGLAVGGGSNLGGTRKGEQDEDEEKEKEDKFEAQEVIQAGHTMRIILPVKRIFLANPYAPIPSLSANKRQFVVSTAKISLEQERQSREAFWFREALLARLSGTWRELGADSDRAGDIELRGIRLTPRMVETLRVEDIGISLFVRDDDSGSSDAEQKEDDREAGVRSVSPSKIIVPTNRFLTLTATLINRTTTRTVHRPILRLLPALKDVPVPAAFELNRRFAINGLLQRPLAPLLPGEQRTVETGFVVLSKGEYEVSASVEEVTVPHPPGRPPSVAMPGQDTAGGRGGAVPTGMTGEDGFTVDVLGGYEASGHGHGGGGRGRGCWVCREVLLVIARDVD